MQERIDVVIRNCGRFGWLYILQEKSTGKEICRGEHKATPQDALERGLSTLANVFEEEEA